MRLVRTLLVLASLVVAFSMLSVGAAFAGHTGAGTEWTCTVGDGGDFGTPCPPPLANKIGRAAQNAFAPVGSHISDTGLEKGISNPNAPDDIIFRNPLCPFHDDFAP